MANTSRVTTWSSGDVLTAATLNGEFDNLLTGGINNIANANVASNAGITYSKLSLTGGIVNADIASNAAIDSSKLDLSVNRAFAWYLDGTEIVRNEAGAKYIAPQDMTCVKVWYRCESGTATIRIQKGTTDLVNSMSVTSSQGTTTSFSVTSITAGDEITLDITAASSPVNLRVTLEATQP